MRICICRKCKKEYEESKSRADWKGYCSQMCMHKMVKRLACAVDRVRAKFLSTSGKPDEYYVLKNAQQIGSVFK